MNIVEKIVVKENKTLKLQNVLIREVSGDEIKDLDKTAYMMESYIKSKGNSLMGPLINHACIKVDNEGKPLITIRSMLQAKDPIKNVEMPYKYESQIKISNCLFARFTDSDENLQFAYSKLRLYAYEQNIKLSNDTYTVFVNRQEKILTADIFVEIEGR